MFMWKIALETEVFAYDEDVVPTDQNSM